MQPATDAVVLLAGEGQRLARPDTGGAVLIKLAAQTAHGAITVYESMRQAGDSGGPGLHRHAGFEELFYVLEGEYLFELNGQTFRAPVGTLVFIPAGATHRFHSLGQTQARLLTICVPGGIEQFFAEAARVPQAGTPASSLTAIGLKHGIEFCHPAEPSAPAACPTLGESQPGNAGVTS